MINPRKATIWAGALIASGAAIIATTHADAAGDSIKFRMQRSPGIVAAGCLPDAKAKVVVRNHGPVEEMKVHAWGLARRTEFDLFVIQVPNAPFGVSWYQGDLETDRHGEAEGTFIGRFNEETFSVAPGVAPAPVRHTSPIADASANPATAPVHQFHVGLWFNSPKNAAAAGCGTAVTPFNGVHDAGVQVLSTRNFAPGDGPLGQIGS